MKYISTMPERPLDSSTCIAVIGVGFVGESLLLQFRPLLPCIGFDISEKRLQELTPQFASFPSVQLTSKPAALARATHYFIAVPTNLKEDGSVNLDFVRLAVKTVLQHAKPGACIVIESSVPVGTTRDLLSSYKDLFHCGMSPERIDPGRIHPSPGQIPKVVSALTPRALAQIVAVYSRAFDTVVSVSRPEVAEMTKLFENCYRMVNIAYVNEMSDACHAHGINPHEMISAASSKPFGFQAFYPGLGVGGHCIPVNPFYLFANNKHLPVLQRATKLMLRRPRKLAIQFYRRCLTRLSSPKWTAPHPVPAPHQTQTQRQPQPRPPPPNNQHHYDAAAAVHLPRILIVSIGFKANQPTTHASPALCFAHTLADMGCARLAYYDPLVPEENIETQRVELKQLPESCWNAEYIDAEFDGLAVCNRHKGVDMGVLAEVRGVLVQSFV